MLRLIYILLLRLHPRFFRDPFAGEMLWIFDQAQDTRHAALLVADGFRSLATQWMFRDFDEQPSLAAAGPAASDRVPNFYTSGSELPPPAALVNGLLGSVAVFALASIAMFYGGNHARVYTYYNNDFHSGTPEARDTSVGPSIPNGRPPGPNETSPGFMERLKQAFSRTPPAADAAPSRTKAQPGAWASSPSAPPLPVRDMTVGSSVSNGRRRVSTEPPPGFLARLQAMFSKAQPTGNPKAVATSMSPGIGSGVPGTPSIEGAPNPVIAPAPADAAKQRALQYFRAIPVLAALDVDQNGELSAKEIDGAPAVLAAFDTNHDGRLDAEECGYHPPPPPTYAGTIRMLMAFSDRDDGTLRGSDLPPNLRSLLSSLGANRAGALSPGEIRNLAKLIEDRHPGRKPKSEILRQRRIDFMRWEPVLAALDANHDGIITAAEIQQAPAALKTLDSNADGRLTLNEVIRNPLNSEVTTIFHLDTNVDGRISTAERNTVFGVRVRPLLDAADRDADGFVTWHELTP